MDFVSSFSKEVPRKCRYFLFALSREDMPGEVIPCMRMRFHNS